MPSISSSAPGKIILCGEHAVVHGYPAIALPVFQVSTTTRILARPNRPDGSVKFFAPAINLEAELSSLDDSHSLGIVVRLLMNEFRITTFPACDIRISSTVPIAAGLGSSASVSISLLRALSAFIGHPLENEVINRIAFEVEKQHHGTPSGIDNSVITYQAPVYYQKGVEIEFLRVNEPATFIIADSGLKSSTRDAVTGVRARMEEDLKYYHDHFSEIGEICRKVRTSLESGDYSLLGALLTSNHYLLRDIGVSMPELDELVRTALENGAAGAKLSGAGLGGNIIALGKPEDADSIARALLANGAVRTIITKIPSMKAGQR